MILGVAVGLTAFLAATAYALGLVLASEASGTVVVDNPSYPGDETCTGIAPGSVTGENFDCDEPKRIERDASAVVRDSALILAFWVGLAYFVAWLVSGVVQHVIVKLAGGDGSVIDTLAISGWSAIAMVPMGIVGLVAAIPIARSTEVAVSESDAMGAAMESVASAGTWPLLILGLIGIAWQAIIWFAGIVELHDLSRRRAGVLAVILWGVGLLGNI